MCEKYNVYSHIYCDNCLKIENLFQNITISIGTQLKVVMGNSYN